MARDEYPAFADDIEVGNEAATRRRIAELRTELERLTGSLDDSRRAKRILFVSGSNLVEETVVLLESGLGQKARAGTDGRSFEVLAPDGSPWCVGAAFASEDGTATKADLAGLMLARSQAGRDEDSAGVLVVNAFAGAETLGDRDHPVAADVARRAAEDRIVIMRTLDLLRLGQRAANGFPAGEQLTEALEGEGGWLEVDGAMNARIHRGGEPRLIFATNVA